ncbi:MAG TPA: hypothetical protein VK158_01345 [Acidobacteriota bacterium]|nr:hypothetical protein [Acidobacteriota bacterium]
MSSDMSVEKLARELVMDFHDSHVFPFPASRASQIRAAHADLFTDLQALVTLSRTSRDAQLLLLFGIGLEKDQKEYVNIRQHELIKTITKEYGSYLQFLCHIKGIDISTLLDACANVLSGTEVVYRSLLQKTSITHENDVGRIMSATTATLADSASVVHRVLQDIPTSNYIRFSFTEQNIIFLSPICVPSDILLTSANVIDSHFMMSGLYHELGHALSLTSIAASNSLYARIEINDISEAIAFLMQNVHEQSCPQSDLIKWYRLFNLRRCIKGMLLEYASESCDMTHSEFSKAMQEAVFMTLDEQSAVALSSSYYMTLDLLLAEFLAAQFQVKTVADVVCVSEKVMKNGGKISIGQIGFDVFNVKNIVQRFS